MVVTDSLVKIAERYKKVEGDYKMQIIKKWKDGKYTAIFERKKELDKKFKPEYNAYY